MQSSFYFSFRRKVSEKKTIFPRIRIPVVWNTDSMIHMDVSMTELYVFLHTFISLLDSVVIIQENVIANTHLLNTHLTCCSSVLNSTS